MALINNTRTAPTPFNKQQVIEDIINLIEEHHPAYYIENMSNYHAAWDLLIIRTIIREVKITIGNAVSPHTRTEQQAFQQVYAISVIDPQEYISPTQFAVTESWTTRHMIVKNAQEVLKGLNN